MSRFKKIIMILLVFAIIMSVFAVMSNKVFAVNANYDINKFTGTIHSSATGVNSLINNTATTAIAVMRVVCVAIAIVILLVIAMKYMMSAPGDRADIKKHAIHYVAGALIMFGATAILTILDAFAQQIK